MNNIRKPYELTTEQLQALQQRGRKLRSEAVLSGLRWLACQLRLAPAAKHSTSHKTALQH